MKGTMWKRICEWLPVVLLGVGCDATIHEYPTEQQSQVIVEVNVDRLPPLYYKELQYDAEGNHTERLMQPVYSAPYSISEDFEMRLVIELYRVSASSVDVNNGILNARREELVNRLMEPPQDTLHFYVDDGVYKVLAWADYVMEGNTDDWHFDTKALHSVRENVEHKPEINHQKNSAAGVTGFSVDFSQSEQGYPMLAGETRNVQESCVVPVDMKRTTGRFRLYSTDVQEFLKSGYRLEDLWIQVIYKQYVSVGYNVDLQEPNEFVPTRTMETRPGRVAEDGTLMLCYDYVLTSNNKEDHVLIDVVAYDASTRKVINYYQDIDIPLFRNQETVLYGPFLTRKVGSGVGINDRFEGEHIVEID